MKYEMVISGVRSLEFGARPLGILSKGTFENTACVPKVQRTQNSNSFSIHYRACRVAAPDLTNEQVGNIRIDPAAAAINAGV
jgi:hypothetical protein